jgi:hypothetical protein
MATIDQVLYYFVNDDMLIGTSNSECFVEVEKNSRYQWYHITKDKTFKLVYLASGITTEDENYRILKRNKKPFLMLFDNEYMKLSDRDIIFKNKNPCEIPPQVLDELNKIK